MFKFLLIISIIKIGFTFRIYLLNEEDKVSVPIEFEKYGFFFF